MQRKGLSVDVTRFYIGFTKFFMKIGDIRRRTFIYFVFVGL